MDEFGAQDVLLHHFVYVGPRAHRADARPPTGRHRDRAVLHVHPDHSRVRAAGRRISSVTSSRSPSVPDAEHLEDPARQHRPRRHPRPLRGRRVRHRRGPDGARGLAGRRGDRGQRARPVRRWKGQRLGTLGRFATQSFHDTKNIVCGEGGALIVNDERDVARARVLYEKGTNRSALFLGQIDKYSWKDIGSSFALANLLAAYLLAQLEKRDVIQGKRRDVFGRYEQALAPMADDLGIRLPVGPGALRADLPHVLCADAGPTRAGRAARMRKHQITPTFHYVPLHSSEAPESRRSTSTARSPTTSADGSCAALLQQPHLLPRVSV